MDIWLLNEKFPLKSVYEKLRDNIWFELCFNYPELRKLKRCKIKLVMKQTNKQTNTQISWKGIDALIRWFVRCINLDVYCKSVMETQILAFARRQMWRMRSRDQFIVIDGWMDALQVAAIVDSRQSNTDKSKDNSCKSCRMRFYDNLGLFA